MAGVAVAVRMGATVVSERGFEDNIVFDTPELSLKAADKILRLRHAGGRSILTLKAPVPGESRHKVREEYETTFSKLQGYPSYQRVVAAQSNFDRILMRVNEVITEGMQAGAESRIIVPGS